MHLTKWNELAQNSLAEIDNNPELLWNEKYIVREFNFLKLNNSYFFLGTIPEFLYPESS
jgi:hypothetical protein